jgi:hypothetical protein
VRCRYGLRSPQISEMIDKERLLRSALSMHRNDDSLTDQSLTRFSTCFPPLRSDRSRRRTIWLSYKETETEIVIQLAA